MICYFHVYSCCYYFGFGFGFTTLDISFANALQYFKLPMIRVIPKHKRITSNAVLARDNCSVVSVEECHRSILLSSFTNFLNDLWFCLLDFQVDCRKFVEQGCLGLSVAALSSRDGNMRKAGYHVLSRYMMHLDGVRFREKKQVGTLSLRWKVRKRQTVS